jgi:cellulose synthase/poly-beta-1,6-N-acetylglucosamine synthase-like glycosyltransferase
MTMFYYLFASFLLFYACYFAITILAGFLFKNQRSKEQMDGVKPYVILIPAFRPNQNLERVLRSLKCATQHQNVKIYVLLQESSMAIESMVRRYAHWVDHKSFSSLEGNPYHHALNYAVRRIDSYCFSTGFQADSVLLLDQDNTIDESSLNVLQYQRNIGADVVQARRKAAFIGNATSTADALSERINDFQLRRGKQTLGLLPEISGSGILFERSLFSHAVANLDKRAPGMDKNLLIQMLMLKPDLNLIYTEEAVIEDEKTDDKAAYSRQRTRWFANQYFNAIYYAHRLLAHTIRHRSLKGVDYLITLLRPPRSVQLALINVLAPFEIYLWSQGGLPSLMLTSSALFMDLSLITLMLSEGVGFSFLSSPASLIYTLKFNLASFLQSLNPRLLGTFIHTRNA